ncbi:DUF6483 family protein [Paenibacillus sp. J22TS3]|uniref:DUF6483 family protein n=1 Tax=Paenibacillus sp. J22TS3 TaxID=2807192 RepID=UPI001B0A1128|nr:DUF6483 family protein [Paenibacillus sp. J22TS3]GIP24391.1 hypothetical protein J22TS3_46660 [Paenibacillus sp. J22TS3]
MLRKDYLLRMVEEMLEAVATVLGARQQKKHTEALWQLDEQFKRHFRLSSDMMNTLSTRDLIELFRTGGVVEVDKLQSAARLMKEEGLIYLDNRQEEAGIIRSIKSLHLFLYAALNGADRSLWDLDTQVRELQTTLKGYVLPLETESLLFEYEESQGRYDWAENSLYRLLEQKAITPAQAEQFYDRLLALNPQQLEEGGLPAAEIEEGRAGLRRYQV